MSHQFFTSPSSALASAPSSNSETTLSAEPISDLAFDLASARGIVAEALTGADDGELYLEHTISEVLVWTDGRLKTASYDVNQGFGLRAVAGEFTAYAHSSNITLPALKQAAGTVLAAKQGYSGSLDLTPGFSPDSAPKGGHSGLYADHNPLETLVLADKIQLLGAIDQYVRDADPRVAQATISIATEYKQISIVRPDGAPLEDTRPLTQFSVSVTMKENGRTESGRKSLGGREDINTYINAGAWKNVADQALQQARINLQSQPTPAGEMTIVLGPGFPGVLFHEAVGHGLEGDFNRKGTSVFSGKIGTRVASEGVTVVDDGTLPGRRGSLQMDDEGTPTQRNVLIEDGILKAYMQDRLNGRLMQTNSSGNGRRESYAHMPMPRMTNTFLENGQHNPAEIISSVKDGIYAVDFAGGQVDITSGKFVFAMSEAYRIENGKITTPLKGATMIGAGDQSLLRISMIGDDLSVGDGMCGKNGQSVPAGVGTPTLRLDGMTVGGVG